MILSNISKYNQGGINTNCVNVHAENNEITKDKTPQAMKSKYIKNV
jgi:hypothetical protein